MKIYADRRDLGKIQKKTEDYVNRYNSQKALYDEYASKITEEIKSLFKEDLQLFTGGDIEVEFEKRNDIDTYAVNFRYYSHRGTNLSNLRRDYEILVDFKRNSKTAGNFSGISWSLLIYTDSTFALYPESAYVYKIPQLEVGDTDYDDMPELRATYKFFEKVDSFDWVKFFTKVYEESPKLGEFKTNLNDGSLNIDALKTESAIAYLDSTVGKDVWILVADYNGNMKNTYNHKGYHIWYADKFWVRITKSSNSFYFAEAIPNLSNYGYDDAISMRIKKTSLHLVEPIEVKTTDEFNQSEEY